MKKRTRVILLVSTFIVFFALSFFSIFIYKTIKAKNKLFDIEKDGYIKLALQDVNQINYVCIDKSLKKLNYINKFESQNFGLYIYDDNSIMDVEKNPVEETQELSSIIALSDVLEDSSYFQIYKVEDVYIVSEVNLGPSGGLLVYLYKDNSLVQLTIGVLDGNFIVGIEIL